MIRGKTETGFEFEVEETVLDDYELIESLREVDKGNVMYIVDVVDMLLGAEQKSALKEHLRKENGKITFTDMCNEVVRIFNASKEIKNL